MAQLTMLRYLAPKPVDTSRSQDVRLDELALLDSKRRTEQTIPQSNYALEMGDSENAEERSIAIDMSPKHHPGITVSYVESSHIDALKQLTSATLPMRYPDKFFKEAIYDSQCNHLARVALFQGRPVGWIRCRPESSSSTITSAGGDSLIYIQALCILAPYRQLGIASHLISEIVASTVAGQSAFAAIYAHVWESNEDAIAWYERRGFKRVMLLDQYYRRLRPSGAWIVRKEIT